MYQDIYGHCPTCNRIHWRDKGCNSESEPFWSKDKASNLTELYNRSLTDRGKARLANPALAELEAERQQPEGEGK